MAFLGRDREEKRGVMGFSNSPPKDLARGVKTKKQEYLIQILLLSLSPVNDY
jgi:hypothetical protein